MVVKELKYYFGALILWRIYSIVRNLSKYTWSFMFSLNRLMKNFPFIYYYTYSLHTNNNNKKLFLWLWKKLWNKNEIYLKIRCSKPKQILHSCICFVFVVLTRTTKNILNKNFSPIMIVVKKNNFGWFYAFK